MQLHRGAFSVSKSPLREAAYASPVQEEVASEGEPEGLSQREAAFLHLFSANTQLPAQQSPSRLRRQPPLHKGAFCTRNDKFGAAWNRYTRDRPEQGVRIFLEMGIFVYYNQKK